MKRRVKCFLFILNLIMFFAGLGLSSTPMAAEKVWNLRGQVAWGPGLELWEESQKIVFLIGKYTDGRIKMKLHSGGELCPPMEEYDAVGRRAIDFGGGCPCYALPKCYALPLYCDSPSNVSGIEKIAWLYHGGGLEIFQDLFAKHYNVKAFPYAIQSSELWIYSNKEIKTISDVKGLKMRSAGIRADIFKSMGGTLVILPAGEVIPAMQRGVIDAFEVSNIDCGVRAGYLKAAKYLYFNPLKTAHSMLVISFNLDLWKEFPKEIQEAIETACKDSVLWSLNWNRVRDLLAMKRAVEKEKCELRFVPEKVMQEFFEISEKFYHERASKDPEFARVLESWTKWAEEYGAYARFMDYLDKTGTHFGLMKPYKK